MLKGIPPIISPELIKILMEMGHGDEIVFGDSNFPGASHAKKIIYYTASPMLPLLDAVCKLFPLDYLLTPVALVPPPQDFDCPIQKEYLELLGKHHGEPVRVDFMDRWDFYDRAAKAHAVVKTGEPARFANIILRKGVVIAG